jgi:hypothetical protein
MYLAAIADAQPPPPTPGPSPSTAVAAQMATPHSGMQPPSYFMQHPQASPAGIFAPRGPLQFGSPLQFQDPQQQQQIHQQAMQGHMGIRPMGMTNNGMQHAMQQPETGLGGNGNSLYIIKTILNLINCNLYPLLLSLLTVGLRGGKQDGADGQGKDDGK